MLTQDLYATALTSPPTTPQNAPVRTYFGGRLQLRVPPDESALHDLIREAHGMVVNRHSSQPFESAMKAQVARLIEERPVFWSRVWPAGLAMGKFMMTEPRLVAGKTVMELGCGLGPGALCAALARAADVVATDIEPLALAFLQQSAVDNHAQLRTHRYDWNAPTPAALRGPFDVVLAGDVIYQDEHAPRLGQLLVGSSLLKPGGTVIFSDSLERPYGTSHQSVLCEHLLEAMFQQVACHDVDLSADLQRVSGVAAGHRVRLLVYTKPGPRSGRTRAG